MKIVTEKNKITIDELNGMAIKMFGDLVKAVVDIEKQIMAINMAMHGDAEYQLLENKSNQESLWGVNLYQKNFNSDDFIKYNSLINISFENKVFLLKTLKHKIK